MTLFASPDFEITPIGVLAGLLILGLMPVFIVSAFKGLTLFLGIFQLVQLCISEIAQWQFTRHARLSIKLLSAGATYLTANILITIGVMYLLAHVPRLGSYLYGK